MELQEPSRPQRVCVLGAGVSGVSVCLALEEKGFAVDLIGRYESFYYKVAGNKAAGRFYSVPFSRWLST